MNSQMKCDQLLLLQAEFDGELDVSQSNELTVHRQGCAHCQDAWEALMATRQSVRQGASYHPASSALKSRLDQSLAAAGLAVVEQPRRPKTQRVSVMSWLWTAMGFGLGTAFAVVSTLVFFQPGAVPTDMAGLVVASHLRSMQADHLLDIASNDQHNVKPWFDGKVDFAPPVKNLSDKGYPLAGGRLDYLQDQEVAALVYRSGSHLINMLVWPSSGAGEGQDHQYIDKDGYQLTHWRDRDLTIWVVTDLDRASLQKFISLWQTHD